MVIEKTKDELIIRLPSTVNVEEVEDFLRYLRYQEITSKFKVKQVDVNKLAKSINKSWFESNKSKFLNEDNS
ncbi:MAG: hypothetical protein RIG68_15445 [Imperialibacter sp.]|uniref:hypothetical protein n=1 Tax=Imperialibacter sp. TaxID=2038411 RepID=UPI0032ECEBAA